METCAKAKGMTAADFYTAVLTLWGESWRPELDRFLREHGLSYSRQSFWHWRKGVYPVPALVADLIHAESAGRRS